MNAIYRMAKITILASAGRSAQAGLSNVKGTARIVPPVPTIDSIRLVSSSLASHFTIPDSVWASRGLTRQEVTLSCRQLVFTEDRVAFRYRRMNCQESLDIDLDLIYLKRHNKTLRFIHFGIFGDRKKPCFAPIEAQNTGHWSSMSFFSKLFLDYSPRGLTYNSDAP
jgi:hypothetical protein